MITIPPIQVLTRTAAWVLATAIAVVSAVPPSLRPETWLPHAIEHFAIYWATGIAFALGYTVTPLIAAILIIFSGAVEILQFFVPGRHARLNDFLIDAFACIIGLLTVPVVTQIGRRIRT